MEDMVLIVDDDEAVRTMLYKAIRSNGIEAQQVSSGEQALQWVSRNRCDLIIMDINMPGMDGFQVIQTLRNRGVRTPIMIVSGRQEDYDTLYGLDIGADDYVTKPFSMPVLLEKIRVILRRSAGAEEERCREQEHLRGEATGDRAAHGSPPPSPSRCSPAPACGGGS